MFIVIEERGEYSYFDYRVVACYKTLADAEYAVKLLTYEYEQKGELSSALDNVEYVIKEAEEGQAHTPESFHEAMQKLQEDYSEKVAAAQVRFNARMHQLEQHAKDEKQQALDNNVQQVKDLLQWWKSATDPAKKEARMIASIKLVQNYIMLHPNDKEAVEWYYTNVRAPYENC